MNWQSIESISDPRIASYRNLRERTLRGESVFIAEGELVVRRLLDSPYEVESLLVVERFLPEIADAVPPDIPVYLVREAEIGEIVGFSFYQGILALGKRPLLPGLELVREFSDRENLRLVVLPDVTKPENLGLTFRSCAALGATAVVLGERCCDPFSRRALRVSMGGVLQVPIIASPDLASDLKRLRDEFAFELWGTVLDPAAQRLPEIKSAPPRIALLFGNEYEGLTEPWAALCQRKAIIPMSPGIDSLNLGVSVGIFLYELQRIR